MNTKLFRFHRKLTRRQFGTTFSLSLTAGADLIGAFVTSACLFSADLGTNGSHSRLRLRLREKSIPKCRPPRRVGWTVSLNFSKVQTCPRLHFKCTAPRSASRMCPERMCLNDLFLSQRWRQNRHNYVSIGWR